MESNEENSVLYFVVEKYLTKKNYSDYAFIHDYINYVSAYFGKVDPTVISSFKR